MKNLFLSISFILFLCKTSFAQKFRLEASTNPIVSYHNQFQEYGDIESNVYDPSTWLDLKLSYYPTKKLALAVGHYWYQRSYRNVVGMSNIVEFDIATRQWNFEVERNIFNSPNFDFLLSGGVSILSISEVFFYSPPQGGGRSADIFGPTVGGTINIIPSDFLIGLHYNHTLYFKKLPHVSFFKIHIGAYF